ncbi:MAG: hypothetical protein R2733_24050 [Acidimicrobiales bacterium]
MAEEEATASEAAGSEEAGSGWVIEPPGVGQIKVALGLGEGAELTPEAVAAFEQLMEALHDEEVVGFSSFSSKVGLDFFGPISLDLKCGEMTCSGTNVCDDLECGKYYVVGTGSDFRSGWKY